MDQRVESPQNETMTRATPKQIGKRLEIIRAYCIKTGRVPEKTKSGFCKVFGFNEKTWGRWENGTDKAAIPWWEAGVLVEGIPGVTLDYIYLGRTQNLWHEIGLFVDGYGE